jgi:hypothetical protein
MKIFQSPFSGGLEGRAVGRNFRAKSPALRAAAKRGVILSIALLAGCGYRMQGSQNPDLAPGYAFDADASGTATSTDTSAVPAGYQWKSLYREDIQTVAVPVFVNRTYRRGLESKLTQSIIQQLEEHTPYKVVSRDQADTVLEGTIEAVQTYTLANDIYTGLPQEQSYTISVSFAWKNLRTGKVLVSRKGFDERASYFAVLGESSEVGAQDAVDKLALSIVQEMQADW